MNEQPPTIGVVTFNLRQRQTVLDAFVECGYWRDDAQVYDGRITKWWAAIGEEPHTEIVITLQPSTGAIESPTPTP